jgi:hypothetical protein
MRGLLQSGGDKAGASYKPFQAFKTGGAFGDILGNFGSIFGNAFKLIGAHFFNCSNWVFTNCCINSINV